MFQRFGLIVGFLFILIPVQAQFDIYDYHWELADIAFSYPANWDEPFAVQRFGIESLILASSDARNTERDLNIPTIIMTIQPNDGNNINSSLQSRLNDQNLPVGEFIRTTLFNEDALFTQSINTDNNTISFATATRLSDSIFTVVGRTPINQQEQFESIYNLIIRSLTSGQQIGKPVEFGILWNNISEIDYDTLFIDVLAIALDETNQTLYATDSILGLLRFNKQSGRLEEIIPNSDFVTPQSITIASEDTIYIGDPDCPCIHILQNDKWQPPITNFNIGSPQSILVTDDNTLYATDTNDDAYFIRQYRNNSVVNLFPEFPLLEHPLLFLKNHQIHLLDQTTGNIQYLDNDDFVPLSILETDNYLIDIQVASDGTYLLITDSTIEFYTPDNYLLNSLDIADYSASSTIQDIVLSQDNTLYAVTFGSGITELIALSQKVRNGNIGLVELAPYRISSAYLNQGNPTHYWQINIDQPQTINLEIQGDSPLRDFKFNVTLFNPDGTEILTLSEDTLSQQSFSRTIKNLELPNSGTYEVRIDLINGEGRYDITLITPTPIPFDDRIEIRWGRLSESYTTEIWSFEATSRTTLSIIMEANTNTQLVPDFALFDPRSNLVMQSVNSSNGSVSRISEYTIPYAGVYQLVTTKLEGRGRYRLIMEQTEG